MTTIPDLSSIAEWLVELIQSADSSENYKCRLLVSDPLKFDAFKHSLRAFFKQAHSDASKRIRRLERTNLHPLGIEQPKLSDLYPCSLHSSVLTGYFGEVLGAIVAKHFLPFSIDWEAPVFLFRYHKAAFDCLERCIRSGTATHTVPGRLGNDIVCFSRDENGNITTFLLGEAKCRTQHDQSAVDGAFKKMANETLVDLMQITEVLEQSDDVTAQAWLTALRDFGFEAKNQLNMICYVCAQRSRNGHRLPVAIAPDKHTSSLPLEAFDVLMPELQKVIKFVYDPQAWKMTDNEP